MKKIVNIPALSILILSIFVSCKKDDNSVSAQASALNAAAVQGKWKVTLYNDNGTDQTNHYTGYEFQFSSNGTVTAAKTGSTISGTWSSGNDDHTLKLVLSFGATAVFSELNDDWHVTQQTSTLIKLEDVSGGGSGTDYLTFEKI
ncbi:lipocalin-like domain-containing protein [Ferruginibacter sp.]